MEILKTTKENLILFRLTSDRGKRKGVIEERKRENLFYDVINIELSFIYVKKKKIKISKWPTKKGIERSSFIGPKNYALQIK